MTSQTAPRPPNAHPFAGGPILDRKADFFDFDGFTYLNCAYHGPMPRVADEALAAAIALRRNPAYIRNEHHFSFPDAYRRAVAVLLNAGPATVSITDSATRGFMVLANGLAWSAGDEVVIPRDEFPSNRLPWLSLADRGVRLREVNATGAHAVDQLAEAITGRTRLVSVSWVRFLDGGRIDLDALSALCRDRDVLLAVDGSQGVGAVPLDLTHTPIDLLACAGYKWLLGPYGLGFVHVAPALRAQLDAGSNVNWMAARGAQDFGKLVDLPFAFDPGPRQWDANETANFFNVAAATAAIRYITALTPAGVHAHCRGLLQRLHDGLPAGFELINQASTSPPSSFGCFRGPSVVATQQAVERLRAADIVVSAREGAIRVSPHVYNTASDIDRLLEVVAAQGTTPGRPRAGAASHAERDPHRQLQRLLAL